MEKQGYAINAIGAFLKTTFKLFLYIIWGMSRVAEVILSELNILLKRILEQKK
jgi:hypothetical protein